MRGGQASTYAPGRSHDESTGAATMRDEKILDITAEARPFPEEHTR
jgi:hypothetical protein